VRGRNLSERENSLCIDEYNPVIEYWHRGFSFSDYIMAVKPLRKLSGVASRTYRTRPVRTGTIAATLSPVNANGG